MKIDAKTRLLIEQTGHALYGDFWQNKLAIALGMHKRKLTRIVYGKEHVESVYEFKQRLLRVCDAAMKSAHVKYVDGCNAALTERDRVCKEVSIMLVKLAPLPPKVKSP